MPNEPKTQALLDSSLSLLEALPEVQRKAPCHGRVEDLETLVPAQWWKTVFADSLYLKTDGDVVEDPEITLKEITLLESKPAIKNIFERASGESLESKFLIFKLGKLVETPAKILDLCCGQGY